MTSYRSVAVNPEQYRPPAGLSREDRAAEQDAAAGGRHRRYVNRPNNSPALASVALRCFPKSRRVYAYLRWSDAGGTEERYLGEVSDHADRARALSAAWKIAVATGTVTSISTQTRRVPAEL